MGEINYKYKPLTPSFRADIESGIDKEIQALETCNKNALVNMQIESLKMTQRLINGLPDGYPMPIRRG